MNPLFYNIDFNKLVLDKLPSILRQQKIIAYLKIAASPFVFVYQIFLNYRKAKLYDLMITPQVCYLEIMLNDKYDFTQRRIYIEDGVEQPALYLYQDAEDKDIYLFTDAENDPKLLYTDGEIEGISSDDFIIKVPVDIIFNQLEMRSAVQRKRLPGMRFKIQTF